MTSVNSSLNPILTYSLQGLIRLLSTCASGSPLGAKTLLLLGISGTLKDILSGSGLVAGVSVFPALTRPAEQVSYVLHAFLCFLGQLAGFLTIVFYVKHLSWILMVIAILFQVK